MKKILIALALLAGVQLTNAQVKSPSAAAKAVEKAEVAAQDAKKAAKVGTWVSLAKAYMDAYNAPAGNAWVGASAQELALIMGAEKPVSEEQVELARFRQGRPNLFSHGGHSDVRAQVKEGNPDD